MHGSTSRSARLLAPMFTGWVLLEHPGPWRRPPADRNTLIPPLIRKETQARGVRVNLIRAPLIQRPPAIARALLVSTVAGRTFAEQIAQREFVAHLPEILDALAAGQPSGRGTLLAERQYLVCTDGERNPACGRSGGQVMDAVSKAAGTRAWETTHVGGCRAAVNLVCLPEGIYYGGVQPSEVATVLTSTEAGRIALPWYRGRAGLHPTVQSAEIALRHAIGNDALDGIRPCSVQRIDSDGTDLVRMESEGDYYDLILRPGFPDRFNFTILSIDRVETASAATSPPRSAVMP